VLWLRVYTAGLPGDVRRRRREQLESDIWEHEAERRREEASTSAISAEIAGRVVRGMGADLLWRFQLEGPKVQIKIPFERVTGLLLLALVLMLPVSIGIDGYDTSRDSWRDELRRLGDLAGWEVNLNLFFQVLCGLGLIVAAAAFYLALRQRAPVLTTIAAFCLAAAGILTLAASAAYAALAVLADDFVAGRGGDDLLTTSRAMAIGMRGLILGATLALAVSVYALATAAHRHRLVPRRLAALPVISAGALVVSLAVETATESEASWVALMVGLAAMLLWLLAAGITLLAGYRASPGGMVEAVPAA
jgi:hypothetical protein